MGYNEDYQKINNVFGSEPEKILKEHFRKIDSSRPVLDIGAGQGRNSFFLADKGFAVDAMDPSSVAFDLLKSEAQKNNWKLRAYQKTFSEFEPDDSAHYSAILIFGLIQILSWQEIEELLRKIDNWTKKGSFVFVTGFTVRDPSLEKYQINWKTVGTNSFIDGAGNARTFLELKEIGQIFRKYQTVYHWEGIGPEHHHGDGKLEQHHLCEAVFMK